MENLQKYGIRVKHRMQNLRPIYDQFHFFVKFMTIYDLFKNGHQICTKNNENSGRPHTSFLVAGFLLIITCFLRHEHYYAIINWDLDHSWDVYSAYSHVTFVYTAFSC